MGLDNYWIKAGTGLKEDEEVEIMEIEDLEVSLCGGMCSGHGSGSFRGKVYAEIIEAKTDISLYEERLSNEQVKTVAKRLKKRRPKKFPAGSWDCSEEEYDDLIKMFEAYGEAGAELISWW